MRQLLTALAALASMIPAIAFADGEAGVVVFWGDGTVTTACVPFEGESVTGETMLAHAGLAVNDFSGLVCAIADTGCVHSGTFASCTCECQPGSGDCTYWSFFTQRYGGSWIYSSVGFRAQAARDGELHAWNWGPGSPASAPAPPAVSFEQVCGHPPLSLQPTATPTTPPPPPPPPVPTATLPAAASPTGTATALPSATAATATATGAATHSVGHSPTPTGGSAVPASTVTSAPSERVSPTLLPQRTPGAPLAGRPADPTGPNAFYAFGAVALVLVALIGGALVWRRSHA